MRGRGFWVLGAFVLAACAISPDRAATYRDGEYAFFAANLSRSGDACLFAGVSTLGGQNREPDKLLVLGADCERPTESSQAIRVEPDVDLTVDEFREIWTMIENRAAQPCLRDAVHDVMVICAADIPSPTMVRQEQAKYFLRSCTFPKFPAIGDAVCVLTIVTRRDGHFQFGE